MMGGWAAEIGIGGPVTRHAARERSLQETGIIHMAALSLCGRYQSDRGIQAGCCCAKEITIQSKTLGAEVGVFHPLA